MDETGAKITELDPILGADVSGADLLPIVDVSDTSMAPTGTNKKLTVEELGKAPQTLTNKTLSSPLFTGTIDGWISAGETWTYASSTTFTISGDKTGKYQKGDKIKLTQTSVKYFYIIGVSYSSNNTTITVTGGSDYSLANATITNPYFSKAENPQGFPQLFNWTPTIVNYGGTLSSVVQNLKKFSISNGRCHLTVHFSATIGATVDYITVTAPVTINATDYYVCNVGDIGGALGRVINNTSSSIFLIMPSGGIPTGSGKEFRFIFSYPI